MQSDDSNHETGGQTSDVRIMNPGHSRNPMGRTGCRKSVLGVASTSLTLAALIGAIVIGAMTGAALLVPSVDTAIAREPAASVATPPVAPLQAAAQAPSNVPPKAPSKAQPPAVAPQAVAPVAAPTPLPAPAALPVAPPLSPEAAAKAAAEATRRAAIETARARCKALLAKVDVVAIPKDTIVEGDCGTLAPVELVSVGKSPQVALSPPAIVTCDLAVAIHDWVKADVQPLARKHLGQAVARMETMSSYSCRNAYGRKMSKLSEHGKANALDIRGFVTVKGDTAYLLQDWGMTAVEIAAAKAAEDKRTRDIAEARARADAEAARVAAAKGGAGRGGPAGTGSGDPLATARTLVDGLPRPGLAIGGSSVGGRGEGDTGFGLQTPNRLGGPKQAPAAAGPSYAAAPMGAPSDPASKAAAGRSAFLRAVQETACKRFMTTLGPESDAAHRNHFHIDLAERRNDFRICN